jgi:hypothetical protein
MTASISGEDPRHAEFLNLSLLYSDFNRPVFLEAILHWFVVSAEAKELAALRRAIRDRANVLKRNGKRGRPRAERDPEWILRSLQIVWQREILGWSWARIAAAAGLMPTRPNIRSLQIRRDLYALLVWQAVASPKSCSDPREDLRKSLESKPVRRMLRSRLSLPFDSHPEECTTIVRALVPRGLAFKAGRLRRPGK